MIKFRQKEYSSRSKKVVSRVLKAVNKADTAIINGSLRVQDKLGLTKRASRGIKVAPKTERQINREAIKTVNSANTLVTTPMNEGINNGLRFASKNPITAGTTFIPIPGSTAVGKVGEDVIKSKFSGYDKFAKKLEERYVKSPISQGLKKIRLPSLGEIMSI